MVQWPFLVPEGPWESGIVAGVGTWSEQNRHLKKQEAASAAASNLSTENCKSPGSCMSVEFRCSSFADSLFSLKGGVCSLLQCCLPDLWHSDSTLYTSAWQSYPVVRNLRIPSVFSWRNFESQANTFILTFLQGCPIFTSCQHMFVWSHSSLPSVTPLPFPSVPLSGIRRELRM